MKIDRTTLAALAMICIILGVLGMKHWDGAQVAIVGILGALGMSLTRKLTGEQPRSTDGRQPPR